MVDAGGGVGLEWGGTGSTGWDEFESDWVG